MILEQRIVTGILLILLLVTVLRLVHRQQLSVSMALLWSGLLTGAMLILAIPGLLEEITRLTGAKFPVSAMTLLALVVITLFFFYFSLVLQRLERKNTQLVRSIALMEHRLRDQRAPTEKSVDPSAQPSRANGT
jgi:hypothetical protein